MADRRGIVVPLLILAFIFLSPDPARPTPRQLYTGLTLDDVVVEEQLSLAQLNNSTFSSDAIPALNLTGLEDDRGYAWDAVPNVRSRARAQVDYALGESSAWALRLGQAGEGNERDTYPGPPLYKNISGFIHGAWVRSSVEGGLAPAKVNLTDYATFGPFGPVVPREFGRNITGAEGDVRIRFRERRRIIPNLDRPLPGNATLLSADFTLGDPSGEHNLRLRGVYFPDAGHALFTTTSEKFAGIFLLPQLALSEQMFEASRTLLNHSISHIIQLQMDREIERFNPWGSTVEGAADAPMAMPNCELVVYLQQHLIGSRGRAAIDTSSLGLLEHELRYPTGASVPLAPDMTFSMLAFSPDCGYILESKGPPEFGPQVAAHLAGPKVEILNNTSRKHVLFFTAVLAAQLLFLKRQMHEASTPSTQSRISLYTISMLALGDGFTFMTFLLVSFFIGGLWTTVMSAAFVSFVGVSFFGMRFLMDIWMVQAPERMRRRREIAEEERRREEQLNLALQRIRATRESRLARDRQTPGTTDNGSAPPPANQAIQVPSANAVAETPVPDTNNSTSPSTNVTIVSTPANIPLSAPVGSLPLPVTAPRPIDTGATPVFMPSDQQGLEPIEAAGTTLPQGNLVLPRESFGSLYTRFYLLLLAILFLSLNATGWPTAFRRVYFTLLGFIYLSFWMPQINRNVQRNCRKALSWEFVLGQSFTRYLPFVYFYSYPQNVMFIEADYISLAILGTWIWVQMLILVSQEIVGPRWFVKKDWAPPAYDYHPLLREDEEGGTLPIGFSQATEAMAKSAPDSPVAGRERNDLLSRASAPVQGTAEKGKRVFDCAICMQELEVPIIESGSSNDSLMGPAGLLARRMYMVTPCRHIFHSACLEGWMKYRLQCPICRETLPPL